MSGLEIQRGCSSVKLLCFILINLKLIYYIMNSCRQLYKTLNLFNKEIKR